MSTDTIPDIFEKPGVPYSTSADLYSTTQIGAALPTVETASVVNPPMGGGAPSSDPLAITFSGTIATPPDMTEGVAITPITIATNFSGGPPPKVYSVFSGTLPPGLALNASTGVVSGTPTTPQAASNVVFRGTDNAGNSANSNGVPFTVVAAFTGTQLLILQANAANGSTPIDGSSYARVPVVGPTTIVQASALKYGSGGMAFTSLNKYLAYTDDGTWDFGTGEFTIRGWIKRRATSGDFQSIVARQKSGAGGLDYSFVFRMDNANILQGYLYVGAGTTFNDNCTGIVTGTYQFISFVRDRVAGKIYVQINGAAAAGTVMANSASVNNPASTGIVVGARPFDGQHGLDADLDDFQIIKGTCLYRGGAAFTPPVQLNPASPGNP